MRRILGSSLIGSIIEYYDFILYATAASLVFDRVFFANLGPGFALFASFATLAVGYIARPLGGIIFGHFGDRIGRKQMLVLSMLLMGGATVLIGVLPTTAQVGIAAPILLVLLRVVQGIAVGGEWGGATLMALEHAPAKKRGMARRLRQRGRTGRRAAGDTGGLGGLRRDGRSVPGVGLADSLPAQRGADHYRHGHSPQGGGESRLPETPRRSRQDPPSPAGGGAATPPAVPSS